MFFTCIIGLLFVAIVFFHYLQGFFSATISAIIAVLASVLAFSWHETIVESLLKGKAANYAHAMVLVALFAFIYMILRVIFDKVIPEGITLPNAIDRAGGALMGAVAACFTLGIFAIAAQELPFGPSIVGYTKYDTADTPAQIGTGQGGQMQTGFAFDNLHSNDAGRFDEADRKQLFPIIPAGVDEIVVNTVAHLSESGSLQGSQPLNDVHPDFLQELYGQRVGIQAGAQHVSQNRDGQAEPTFSIKGLFTLPEVRLVDGEAAGIRTQPVTAPVKIQQEVIHVVDSSGIIPVKEKMTFVTPGPDKDNAKETIFLVARVTFGVDAADSQDVVRISPGAIRLYARKLKDGNLVPSNYYPIGTLEPGSPYPLLYVNKPDDFIFVKMRGRSADIRPGLDVLFAVDKDTFTTPDKKLKIPEEAFIEVKRMFRESLSGKSVKPWSAPDPSIAIGSLHQVKLHAGIVSSTTAPAE